MSKIVKARSVVEDDARGQSPLAVEVEYGGILKRGMIDGNHRTAARVIPTKDSYQDELNRLQIEIKQAKEEMKALGGDLEETRRLAREEKKRQEELVLAQETAEDPEEAMEEARQRVENILAGAMDERDQILSEANEQAAAIADQAKNEGYLEGFSKGFEEAVQEFKDENTPKAVMIADLLEGLSDHHTQLVRQSEDDLVDLALAVAQKIVGKAVETDPAIIAQMLHGIIDENKREEYIKITLSPDLTAIKAKAGKDVRSLLEKLGANVSVVNDPAAPKDSIMMETPKGVVDVSIQTQLDNLSAVIREK